MIRSFLKHNYPVLLAYVLILAALGYVLLNHYKSDIHIVINSLVGNRVVDVFFKYITYVGDGVFVIVLALMLLFVRSMRQGLYILLSYATASLFTTILKRVFFDDVNRPFFVFTYFRHEKLNMVEGAEVLIHNSFPSGHSTAAFALFFSLIFTTDKAGLKWMYFLLALTVAFSRTYLSQHWLIDIYVGSVIGVCFSALLYLALYSRLFMQKLDRSLVNTFRK